MALQYLSCLIIEDQLQPESGKNTPFQLFLVLLRDIIRIRVEVLDFLGSLQESLFKSIDHEGL